MFVDVVKPVTLKVLFPLTTDYDIEINQTKIKMTSLYGLINRYIYVQIPKGLEDVFNIGKICKLLEALYNL